MVTAIKKMHLHESESDKDCDEHGGPMKGSEPWSLLDWRVVYLDVKGALMGFACIFCASPKIGGFVTKKEYYVHGKVDIHVDPTNSYYTGFLNNFTQQLP